MEQLRADMSEWVSGFTILDLYGMGIALCVTALCIAALRLLLPRALATLARRGGVDYDRSAWRHLISPLCATVLLIGLWAIAVQMPVPDKMQVGYSKFLNQIVAVLLTVVVSYGLFRLVNAFGDHHFVRLRDLHDPRAVYVSAVRKIVGVTLLVVATLVALGQLGYAIGPLLASLGVAGIAVALALQDTLGNLFSGFYLTFDQPIRPGDYILLDTGEEGFVEEVGWRNTRIRPWANNHVIIPNTRLANATITNWHLPVPEMSVYVYCGVDYGSDLQRVEQVCVETGREVMQRVEGALISWEPLVRFKEFADSNVNFVVVLRVNDPTAIYVLQHEYIKALHKRFGQEGIEISWPVRKVVFPAGGAESAQAR